MGVDKRTVWGLFATIQRSYILIQGGLCVAEVSPFRAGISTGQGWVFYPNRI